MPKTIRIPLGRCVVDVLMDVPWHVRDELEIYFAANEEEIYRTMGRGCGVELTLECKVHRPGEYGNDIADHKADISHPERAGNMLETLDAVWSKTAEGFTRRCVARACSASRTSAGRRRVSNED